MSLNHKVKAEVGGAASNVKLSGGLYVPSKKSTKSGNLCSQLRKEVEAWLEEFFGSKSLWERTINSSLK